MVFERKLRWAPMAVCVGLATASPALAGDRPLPPSTPSAGDTSPARARLATAWPAPGPRLPTAARPAQARPGAPTVPAVLEALRDAGEIDPLAHDLHRTAYLEARGVARRLTGRRRAELAGALALLDDLAARGELTRARLSGLWATLAANRRAWTAPAAPAPGQRVGFPGSELVWQAYAGQGLQLQVLGSFGKLNGLLASSRYHARAGRLVDELVALAVPRAGGIAWESAVRVGAGDPPWVSAMGQGTAVQALGRAAQRLGRPELLEVGRAALGIFAAPAPAGVRVPSGAGAHYLLYSSDPGLRVLNGFLQSLIGLHDFAVASADGRARELFEAGERAAREELPRHDTGAWSLYSLGRVARESELGYHLLVRDFLTGLCRRGVGEPYCAASERFTAYTREPPVLRLRTRRVRAGATRAVTFGLSKVSRVGVRIERGRHRDVRELGTVAYGRRSFSWAVPQRAGRYTVALTAVDLAGNVGSTTEELVVARARHRDRP